MKKLPLIGLLGYKQCGKNTVATLIKGLGYEVNEQSFAFALRQKACGIFDLDFDLTLSEEGKNTVVKRLIPTRSELLCYDMDNQMVDMFYFVFSKFKRKDKYVLTIRQILQFLGTDVYRAFNENYWLEQIDLGEGVVVTDVRFPNEADLIKNSNGYVVRIINTSQNTNTDSHESEKYIETIKPDFTIINDGISLDTLATQVLNTISFIKEKS